MFSLCKQPHEATAVEFSLTCHFFNHNEKSLVTGGANVLKVYRVIPDADPATRDKYTGKLAAHALDCIASCVLNPLSLQRHDPRT